jgi:hypothetical protein
MKTGIVEREEITVAMKQFDEIVFAVSNNGGIVVNVVF